MYTLTVPYKNYKDIARTGTITLNLDAREVFRMLPELKAVFDWLDSNKTDDPRILSPTEVSQFYTDFENLLLEAWGEMSDDGELFRKSGKYEFQESALFNAVMVYFVDNPTKTGELMEKMLPPQLTELVKNATPETIEAAVNARVAEQEAEIARLKAEVAEKTGTSATAPALN